MSKRSFPFENGQHATTSIEKRRKTILDNAQTQSTDVEQRANNDYTIGWICAITTEYVAARAFLDETHDGPEYVSPHDNNDYTLGRIGKHNVVIAVLPDGEYGIGFAAAVARDMLSSFPNVRIGLMVGIGGGAPSRKHDIRLGDVVVSAPRDGKGGVFQYDFGKTIQDQSFHATGFLNKPPPVLLAAVNGLRAHYRTDGHRFEEAITNVLKRKPRLRQEYKRPDPNSDKLYQSGFLHPPNCDSNCTVVCGGDSPSLISRPERTEEDDNPAIHYGLIASANQLMKDALIRDKLAAEKEVLCFEMEAAGLMDHFPCLVIRGICDYADSHKNKEWQGYAAMAAAAYAKDLLYRIPLNKVEAEKRISNVFPGFQKVVEDHRDIAQEHLKILQDEVKQRWSDKREECLRLFRITDGSKDATYEWYKDRVEGRVQGTCMWFLEHNHFQGWLKQESGPLLISADPGCGKSVLAKYLIDQGLPRSATICYFFFKDQDQNTVRQALCALLHQLFSKKPFLLEHAMDQFAKDGSGLINSTNSLWTVLRNAVQDPQAGPIIIVLDGLDECAETEFEDLIQNIERQFSNNQSGHGKLKYLITSRPYEQILHRFRGLLDAFPRIHIPGEEDLESISQEVNRVIQYRVEQLANEKKLSDLVKHHLAKRLLDIPHRTYLWVSLVFNYLKTKHIKDTPNGVNLAFTTLPKNIYEAYEQILNKSEEHLIVRKALSIILAASRPLTLSEMNIALSINETSKSIHDIDLEGDENFKLSLRSWCGLFVSIHHGKIYLLHQTAREFLLADLASPAIVPSGLHWQQSITTHHAHAVLAELCIIYLHFFNTDVSFLDDINTKTFFLDYSAKNWALHFREARISDDASIVSHAVKICDPNSKSYSAWFKIYWRTTGMEIPKYLSGLMVASYFGLEAVVRQLLNNIASVDINRSTDASEVDDDASEGDDSASENEDLLCAGTALHLAAGRGYTTIVLLLLQNGADIAATTRFGHTALHVATSQGFEEVVHLLLLHFAEIDARNVYGQTALHLAAEGDDEALVRVLLDNKASVTARENTGRLALHEAADSGNEGVVRLLLSHMDMPSMDSYGPTALHWAATKGYAEVVRLLIQRGANIAAKDDFGWTALHLAVKTKKNDNDVSEHERESLVRELLKSNASATAQTYGGITVLHSAADGGSEIVAELLIEHKADVKTTDIYGRTALHLAAESGNKSVASLLIKHGADVLATDSYGRTALHLAEDSGNGVMVQLLLSVVSINESVARPAERNYLEGISKPKISKQATGPWYGYSWMRGVTLRTWGKIGHN